ncbi:tolB protein-related [Quillaja saponaria]|uniref:TolB protein-related n=1 Tax=Quillaja saponaria TaxID=32244 RepID=A0AAD7Q1Y5_QUISA|nr:tolB protein-related [Quillaja saponaria]
MMMLRHATRSEHLLKHRCRFFFTSNTHFTHRAAIPMEPTKGTIVFTTIGRPDYGFDVFSVKILDTPHHNSADNRLTDGISINFNAQFVDDHQSLVFVSERTGFPRIYLTRPGLPKPEALPSVPGSLFHDRPILRNGRLYFVSAHEQPDRPFKSWSAIYSTNINEKGIFTRLSPSGTVDYSPAVSMTGKFIAVASYGSRPWGGEFQELFTEIVVFSESNPNKRLVASARGGWPTWSGDSTLYFHRKAEDGWWSIFRVDFPENLELSGSSNQPIRVTPPGLHCFTPAAFHDGKRIAVATRRRDKNFRHIELFDLESRTFHPVTELRNPKFHHYNPFVSPDSNYLGYHRFRGESTRGESTIPHLNPVLSPIQEIRMLRLNGSFPTFSPKGDLIAFNHDFGAKGGLKVIRSNGSKRWTLLKGRTAFYNSWSPTEKHVIYTSIGPIFGSVKATVQIARITFDPTNFVDDVDEIRCDVKILTKEETGNNAFPACSPDGKTIVFRSGRSGHKNLYIVDAINGEINGSIRRLTDGPWIDTMPSWSPNGDLIAFSSNRHNPDNEEAFSIYVVKPDGSDIRRIHVAGPESSDDVDRERINHVCFSNDGKLLLFTANLGGVTAEPVSWPNQFQPYGDLYIVRLDGSGLRRLTWNGYENGTPTWQTGNDLEMGNLSLGNEVGDKLRGEFEEPLWISCNI